MARQLRIEFEGAYYHIFSRGNNQSNIFHSDEDRQNFLYILADMSERFGIEIYAYVLMDNHYHLLLRTMRPNLSKSMQWLGTRYTRRFNLRNLQKSLWENVKFGLIYGSQEFLEYIRDTYLSLNKNGELPQLNQLLNDEDQQELIENAARLLDCDIVFLESPNDF